VPAELALHGGLRHLALFELDQGLGELGHVAAGVGPVQVAAAGAGPGVLGLLLGDVLELRALLDRGDDGLGLVLLGDQDVAGLVFLAGVGGHELVVFGLDLGVGHGVVLLEVDEQLADQDGLARQFHLGLVVSRAFQAALLRLLHEDLAGDHFFLDLVFHLGGDGPAGALHLLLQGLGALLGDGLAIDDGDVLRGNGQGHRAQHGSGHEAGQELFLHWESTGRK
jgi:hypothetical protein